jgi:poly-gamma-glutamate synthesis protein (capsule biosynthesis protein)
MPQAPLLHNSLSPLTQAAYDWLRAGDIGFINLECPLTDRGNPADKLVALRGDPMLARELKAIGADVITVANNHALDYGTTGLFDTMNALEGANVPYTGIGANLSAALAVHTIEHNGVRVGFIGVASTLAPNSAAGEDRPGVAPIRVFTSYLNDTVTVEENPGVAPFVRTMALENDVVAVERAITEAKRDLDYLLVGMHWGVPNGWVARFQDILAEYQRPLGHRLIDAGADAVVGHHPHVLHGVEWYRERPIMYSLGNYLFHNLKVDQQPKVRRPYPPYNWGSLRSSENLDSVLARLTLTQGAAAKLEMIPLRLNSSGEPQVAEPADASRITKHMQALSQPFATEVKQIQQGMELCIPKG